MNSAFWVSYGAVWLFLFILIVLVLLLYRQFGQTFMAPVQRLALQGLPLGSRVPEVDIEVVSTGETYELSQASVDSSKTGAVVAFAQPTCDICGQLARATEDLPYEMPDLDWIWVEGGLQREYVDVPAGDWVGGWSSGDAAHHAWQVSAVPFAFLIGPNGRVLSKRVINRRQDFIDLVQAAARSTTKVGE